METTPKINLNQLSAEQREALKQEIIAAEQSEKNRVRSEREEYKSMVNMAVLDCFEPLVILSNRIQDVKKLVFDTFETVIETKSELYGTKATQQSHSFTSTDGSITIKVGYRVTDNYDDTVTAGINKVKSYLETLAKDDESASLVETIMNLLKSDVNGNLKASRVLELSKLSARVNSEVLSDGIKIIQESYRPAQSCQFIEVKFKDEHGKERSLPLSISAFSLEDEKEDETDKKNDNVPS